MRQLSCPLPAPNHEQIQLGHGSGGLLTHRLIQNYFVPAFGRTDGHDAADLNFIETRLAFTTDSYVVNPLIFPGGDIGTLAVYGTCNDLAVAGALPHCLSASFILEEGLPLSTLRTVLGSMRRAAEEVGVRIVTGDTKVVERGKGDGLFITTSGIGILEKDENPHPKRIQEGNLIILSGDIGRHGLTILAQREGFDLETDLSSDCGDISAPLCDLMNRGIPVHCTRDITRGGLATVLVELAEQSGFSLVVREADIPFHSTVQSGCDLLGLDPLYVACEGRCVIILPNEERFVGKALSVLRHYPIAKNARIIGKVEASGSAPAVLETTFGGRRVLNRLSGAQLPRIC